MYHFQVVAIVSFQGAAAQNELETQALELLVNFAHKMEQEGLMPNLSEEVSGVQSNGSGAQPTVEGSKAKQAGAPPLQASMLSSPSTGSSCSLAQSGTPVMAPPPSQSLPRSLQQGSLRHELPGPVPECLQSTKGRLVCTPEQMKKFLYGTQQKLSSTSSGSTSVQDVPWILITLFCSIGSFEYCVSCVC